MIDLTVFVQALIGLLATVITTFIVPLIKEKFDSEKFEKKVALATIAVKAAEQIYSESGMGAKKKEYVTNYLAEKGYKVEGDEIDIVIESAVLELKHAIGA